jgi:hypothetical protein
MGIGADEFEVAASAFLHYGDGNLMAGIRNIRVVTDDGGQLFVKFTVLKYECRFEVIISYSWAYQCPVIHFRCFDQDGQMKRFEEVDGIGKHLLPKIGGEGAFEYAYGMGVDPSDGMGAYFIHPCQTEQIMAEMNKMRPKDYLISYWNLYGI